MSVPGTLWVPLTCSRELGLYDAVVAMVGPGEHCGGGCSGFSDLIFGTFQSGGGILSNAGARGGHGSRG